MRQVWIWRQFKALGAASALNGFVIPTEANPVLARAAEGPAVSITQGEFGCPRSRF